MIDPKPLAGGRAALHVGDCIDVMRTLPDNSVDSVVCDPPYHLTSIVKRFGKSVVDEAFTGERPGTTGAYARTSRGFMGKQWDGGDIAFRPETWAEVIRVLKPGGHLVAFSGTRTYHRMACAIEDAGFEVRDMIQYLYGSGFPKSHNINKAARDEICRCPSGHVQLRGVRETEDEAGSVASQDQGERLFSPVQRSAARGGMGEARPQGVGGCDAGRQAAADCGVDGSDESFMERGRDISEAPGELRQREICSMPVGVRLYGEGGRLRDGASACDGADAGPTANADGMRSPHGPSASEQFDGELGVMARQSQSQERGAWPHCERCGKPIIPDGLGSALKPACEPICFARKPLSEPTIAANVLRWGTGAINVDATRIRTGDNLNGGAYSGQKRQRDEYTSTDGDGSVPLSRLNRGMGEFAAPSGRWPANLVHDGSPEVLAGFPESAGGAGGGQSGKYSVGGVSVYGGGWSDGEGRASRATHDSGSAARFFYSAKASKADRAGSKHPTVKPVKLMRWLVRLVTPPGGLVLDPFAGSGTTGEAALAEGFRAILIERETEYASDIERRFETRAPVQVALL